MRHTFYSFTLFFTLLGMGLLGSWNAAYGQTNLPYTEGFESANAGTYTSNQTVIPGLPNWEYQALGSTSRLRTNAGSGYIRSGTRALTIDASTTTTYSQNYLILNLQLANYAGSQDMELSFWYMDHGDESDNTDRVWIRGSSTDTWLPVFHLSNSNTGTGSYQLVDGIDLDATLGAAGQSFTNTFQIRFGQYDNFYASSPTASDGFTFDDLLVTGNPPVSGVDAAIVGISPGSGICPGPQPIKAQIYNNGSVAITSVNVLWSVNGSAQTPASFTGINIAPQDTLEVNLGTFNFLPGPNYTVTASTSSPNGSSPDGFPANDSYTGPTTNTSLSGTYKVGGAAPDFPNLTTALLFVQNRGLCGPVTLELRDGTYAGQYDINDIKGISATNTLTIKADPANSGDVKLSFDATSFSSNYIIRFSEASYVTLDGLSFEPKGSSYRRSIEFDDNNDHITVKNCSFQASSSTSTSTSYAHIYNESSSSNMTEFCTIENNTFRGGSYAMYWWGGSSSSSNQEEGNVFRNNDVQDFYYMGTYFYYQRDLEVSGNTIIGNSNGVYSTNYGLYANYCDQSSFMSNKVVVYGTSSNYGLYLRYCDGTSSNKVKAYNNMVSCLNNTGTTYGIAIYRCRESETYHNSSFINQGFSSTSGRAYYLYASSSIYRNNDFKNNVGVNMGRGAAVYLYNRYGGFTSDYNNFYSNGTYLGYYYGSFGSSRTSLSSWQSFSGQDANSVSVDPVFAGLDDLHAIASGIDGAGATGLGVAKDIDGDVRCPGAGCPGGKTAPDMGADEFDPPTEDAAAVDVTSPCPGTSDVFVTVQNLGINTLTSAKVYCTINGTPTAGSGNPYNLGSLATGGKVQVNVGQATFASGTTYNIEAWTSDPNGVTDKRPSNDKLTTSLSPALAGTYKIGGSNPDFADIAAAIAALNSTGVCGPVTLLVREGTYVGNYDFGAIPGGSATNTVTLKADPANTGDVVLNYTSSSSSSSINYIMRFSGASYISIEGLDFRPLGTYNRSIFFDGSNDHIDVKNCTFLNIANSTSTSYSHIYNESGSSNKTEFCTFEGNTFDGGSYAIYWYGGSSSISNQEDGNRFINNTLVNFYRSGLHLYYQKNMEVSGNEVIGRPNDYSYNYGIYASYCDYLELTGNKVVCQAPSYNYGIYVRYCDGNSSNYVQVNNNMVSCLNNRFTTYGLSIYRCRYTQTYHNTAYVNQGYSSTSGRAFYLYASSSFYNNNDFQNNVGVNTGGGVAVYLYNRFGGFTSNFNNFYSTGTYLGYYYRSFGSSRTDLASWQSYSGQDANSISVDPLFLDEDDLHALNPAMDGLGKTGLGITTDIDGDTRCPGAGCPGGLAAPDMGADEYDPPTVDAGVVDVSSPCPGLVDVKVTVQNFALFPLNRVKINVQINGAALPNSGNYFQTGGIALGETAEITVGQFNFVNGNSYTIEASTEMPNGLVDPNTFNDAFSETGSPSMAGTYTIGGPSADFPDINSAVAALEANGVCAPVTMLITEGIYNEQVYFGTIPGASAAADVTFKPNPANSQAVEITYNSSSFSNPATLRFDGTSWVTLEDLMISATGSSYMRGIEFEGSNDYLTLRGLTVQNNNTTSTSTYRALLYNRSGSSNQTQNTTVEACTFKGGSYAAYWWGGGSTSQEEGNRFLDNTFEDYHYMGLYLYYQGGVEVRGNELTGRKISPYSTNYALYGNYCDTSSFVGNRIVSTASSSNYGLYLRYCDGQTDKPVEVHNNMISCLNNSSTTYGLYSDHGRYQDIYHNSVLVNAGSNFSGYAFRFYSTSSSFYTGINVKNNIGVNTGGGYAVGVRYTSYINSMDNNNWYATGNYLAERLFTDYANLSAWQSATPFDDQSLSVNAPFDGLEDLHVASAALDSKGEIGLGITTDIDGDTRCPGAGCPGGGTAPDLGADEFEVPPYDVGVTAMINPVDGKGCEYRTFEPVIVTISNFGSQAINFSQRPVTLKLDITGASTQSIQRTIPFGVLPPGADLTFPIGPVNLAIGGLHVLDAYTVMNGDGKAGNDHFYREINVGLIDQFPYLQTFDNMATCNTSPSADCELSEGWSNDRTDWFDWKVDANGTPSSGTGPSDDANGGGNYLYAETSSPNYPNREAIVNLPCINLSGMTCPLFYFDYHMYGASMGRMEVEVFDGTSWNVVYTLNGQQQTNNSAAWRNASVQLRNFVQYGIVKVRFKCTTSGPSWTGDMAIDNVGILDLDRDFVADIASNSFSGTVCDLFSFESDLNGPYTNIKWDISGGTQGIDWVFDGSSKASSEDVNIKFRRPGTFTIDLNVSTECGILHQASRQVVVGRGNPTADFTSNIRTGQAGVDLFQLFDQTTPNGTDWTWVIAPGTPGVDFFYVNGTSASSKNPALYFLTPGSYAVRLDVNTDCGRGAMSKARYFTVTSSSSPRPSYTPSGNLAFSTDDIEQISVFPNPFTDKLNVNFVSLNEQDAELKLSDMMGKVIHTETVTELGEGVVQVEMQLPKALAAGVYVLSLRQGKEVRTTKVIRE